jgi:hypothetical protein
MKEDGGVLKALLSLLNAEKYHSTKESCNQLYETGRILLASHKAVTFMKAGKGVWGLVCSSDNELQGAKLLRTVQCPKSLTPPFTARCSLRCDSLPRPACTRHRTLAMFTEA